MGQTRKFTTEERQKLQELLELGYSHARCGREIGRGRSSITSEILKGKVDEKYSWEHSERNKTPRYAADIMEKVKLLEMQLEILTDQIRKINERYTKNK